MAKIAVVSIIYNNDQWLDKSTRPWIELHRQGYLSLSVVHGVTPEMYGITNTVNSLDQTQRLLKTKVDCNGFFYQESLIPAPENELRNLALNTIRNWQDMDYVFIFDAADELFTIGQIKHCIQFADSEPFIDCFKVAFKNYVRLLDKTYYYFGFEPPRIWRINKKNSQFQNFHYDNDATYSDGKNQGQLSCMTIPDILVEHHSWDGKPSYLENKYKYQIKHFNNVCSYEWTDNGLILNQEYYSKYGVPYPILHEVAVV